MVEVQVSPEAFSKMAYDRAIVVFSPEGRLYQVEYAQRAVENAPTAVGVTFKGGVVLLASKFVSKLQLPEGSEKVVKLDEHIGATFCGMAADARMLIEYARVKAQIHRITYNEPIAVKTLAKYVANRKQQFTQIGGIRPFGVSLLIGGVDDEDEQHLFETDPAGTLREWQAAAIGRGAKSALEVLEREWKQNLDYKDALKLAAKALRHAEQKLSTKNVEGAVIEQGKYREISHDELKRVF